jgi:hypothetical protein
MRKVLFVSKTLSSLTTDFKVALVTMSVNLESPTECQV